MKLLVAYDHCNDTLTGHRSPVTDRGLVSVVPTDPPSVKVMSSSLSRMCFVSINPMLQFTFLFSSSQVLMDTETKRVLALITNCVLAAGACIIQGVRGVPIADQVNLKPVASPRHRQDLWWKVDTEFQVEIV